MAKEFWFNLSVADVEKSRKFYKQIGFKENEMHKDVPHFASFYVDEKKVVMMLFPKASLEHFLENKVVDTALGNEVLLNIDATSEKEVDAFAERVTTAGGTVYAKPARIDGRMYGMGFTDPDGHRWVVLYMDFGMMK